MFLLTQCKLTKTQEKCQCCWLCKVTTEDKSSVKTQSNGTPVETWFVKCMQYLHIKVKWKFFCEKTMVSAERTISYTENRASKISQKWTLLVSIVLKCVPTAPCTSNKSAVSSYSPKGYVHFLFFWGGGEGLTFVGLQYNTIRSTIFMLSKSAFQRNMRTK